MMWTCLWVMATLSVKYESQYEKLRGFQGPDKQTGALQTLHGLELVLRTSYSICKNGGSIVGRVLSLVFKLLSNCHLSFPSVVFPLAYVRLCAAPTGTSQSRFSPVLVFRQPAYGGARRPRCLCCGRRLCFCSIIGWGGKWKALRSCSPLFLSSCVLTFSPYLSLSPSPCRTTHWVSTRSETEARQDLAAQPGPPTQSRRGTPISTSQPIKVSFATHM